MSPISQRGQALVHTPPLAPYIGAHFERIGRPWHPEDRPDGYIALCIAENKLNAETLIELLESYRGAPSAVLGYDDVTGNEEFRAKLAEFMSRRILGRRVEADALAVVAGAGSVLEMLFYALADPGEGVLVPTPSYAGFWADLNTRNALEIVPVPCRSEDEFRLGPRLLDQALAGASCPVRALLFTTPSNPLGRVYGREELEEVMGWAESNGLHVVFDEIYALSVFGERPFVSGASLRPSLGARVHVVWGFSKDFGASGLRCGVLLTENQDVRKAVGELAYWSVCSGHTQYLLSRLVSDAAVVDEYLDRMQAGLGLACRRVMARLDRLGIPYLPAEAGFFLVCDLRSHLDAPTWEAERRLWRRVLEEANVNLTPGEACRAAEPGFFRLCYGSETAEAVEVALDRLGRLLGPARKYTLPRG